MRRTGFCLGLSHALLASLCWSALPSRHRITARSAGAISSDPIPSGFQWRVEHLRTSASLQIAPKAEFDFRAIKRRRGSVPAERRNV